MFQATDAKMSAVGNQADPTKCSEYKVDRGLDGSMTFHSVCDMGTGGTVTSTGTITGDFNSEYTAKFDSEVTGAAVPQMNRKTSMTLTAKWSGACPADMKPGDMSMAGIPGMPAGMKIPTRPPAPK